jgi:hypothetical protein
MSVPPDEQIMFELLRLLSTSSDRTLECAVAYERLSRRFPQLTDDEINQPFHGTASLWENRIQWARQHCVQRGLIHKPADTPCGVGFWTLTDLGFTLINMFAAAPDGTAIPTSTLHVIFRFDAKE